MPEEATDQSMLPRRLAREMKTVRAMIEIYCRETHSTTSEGLCEACLQLAIYAEKRLAGCPFQQNKPTCGTCRIHCYKPDMRQRIKAVMHYSGPRMILNHPLLAIAHLLDEKLIRPPRIKANPSAHSKSRDDHS
jgi:hypothetical protein